MYSQSETHCIIVVVFSRLLTSMQNKKEEQFLVPLLLGRQDSNLRPPGPKPGALTGLRYFPIYFFRSGDLAGTRTQDPNIKSVMLYQLSYQIIL